MAISSNDRVRVTISLSKEIATQIDETIDGIKVRNRSHAIETLVTESLDVLQVKQAVVLIGGENALERLEAIKQILRLLSSHGIFRVMVAVGFLGDRIRKELGDGEAQGLKIEYFESELGTGGVLAQLKPKLKKTFLVINIHTPVSVDLKNLLKFHRDHQPLVTIATRSLRELSGVYVMEPKALALIPSGFCMLEDTVFDELTRRGKLLSYPILSDYKD